MVSFPQVSPRRPCICISSPPYALHALPISQFYHPNNVGWGVQIIKLLIMWYSPLPCYLIPLRPKYSPLQPFLKHPQSTWTKSSCCVLILYIIKWTLSLHFSLNASDLVSHPYKTTDRIIVLYTLIFTFLDSNLEDKILHWMIASIPWFQSALNFFLNRTLIC